MVPIAIKPLSDSDPIQYGLFCGLLSNASSCDRCSDDGVSAVVQIDGHGMMLTLVHPSRVVLIKQSTRD